ncbi:hypothetical protein [Streptomyces sp. SP17KL33]|uniref:hypothetical protein n=1 Tax=Streptomyces sp. SP17KL33 TaxID=3002534 RepID=UPI003FCE230E
MPTTYLVTHSSEVQRSTGEYKIKPIKKKVRELLGHPYPQRIPKSTFVEQWVGISTDKFHRAKDADVQYMRNRHPLIELGWTRADCARHLSSVGLDNTPKSSCSFFPIESSCCSGTCCERRGTCEQVPASALGDETARRSGERSPCPEGVGRP